MKLTWIVVVVLCAGCASGNGSIRIVVVEPQAEIRLATIP